MPLLGNSFRRVALQVSLILTNTIIAVLGLLLVIVGTWYHAGGSPYFILASKATSYTSVSALLIVIGLLFITLGALGTVGASYSLSTGGRIVLLLHSFIMVFAVVCEVANGISAYTMNDKVNNALTGSANRTFQELTSGVGDYDAWNAFVQEFSCCGLNSTREFVISVPNGQTCCFPENCTYASIVTFQACLKVVETWSHDNFSGISGIAFTIGIIQVRDSKFWMAGIVTFLRSLPRLKIFSILASCVLAFKRYGQSTEIE